MDVPRLKGIIAERGLTQAKVAKHIGISERTFYIKMKKGVFGTDEAQKMVDLLNIQNPADIFLSNR